MIDNSIKNSVDSCNIITNGKEWRVLILYRCQLVVYKRLLKQPITALNSTDKLIQIWQCTVYDNYKICAFEVCCSNSLLVIMLSLCFGYTCLRMTVRLYLKKRTVEKFDWRFFVIRRLKWLENHKILKTLLIKTYYESVIPKYTWGMIILIS